MRAHWVEQDLKLIFASVALENRGLRKAFESVRWHQIVQPNPACLSCMMAEACSGLIGAGEAKVGGSRSSICDPMVSRTCGPRCAAGHRDGIIDVRVTVEKGEF
jgi:hypothetical protein